MDVYLYEDLIWLVNVEIVFFNWLNFVSSFEVFVGLIRKLLEILVFVISRIEIKSKFFNMVWILFKFVGFNVLDF